MQKCASMEIGLWCYTIKFILSKAYWKICGATKFKAQSKKKEWDGAHTAQIGQTGFAVLFGWPPLCSAPRASFQTGFPAYSEPTWFWIYFLCEKLREHILDLFPTGIIPPPYINGRIMANWVFQLPIIKKHITYPFCRNSLYLVVHHVSWLDLAAF